MNVRQYYRPKIQSGQDLFFDLFSGGLGGFSFRKLVGSYTGRWGRAINKTTLVEADIGFVGNVADTAAMVALSNGTDNVQLISYDNSFVELYIGVPPAAGPTLVSAGTLVTLNGLPAADFPPGARLTISLSDVATVDPSPVSIYSLGKIDTLRQRNLSVGSGVDNTGYFHGGTLAGYNGIGVFDPLLNVTSLADEDLNRRLGVYHWNSTTLKLGSNNSALTSFAGLNGAFIVRNIGIGLIASAQSFSGKIQEVLLFGTNKEANDTDIRTNINSFYSIW